MTETASQAAETWSRHHTFILTNRMYHHEKRCPGFTGSLEKLVEDYNWLYPGLHSLNQMAK